VDDVGRLLLAAKDGDRDAFARAVRTLQPDVWRFVHHLTSPHLVEDVVQDTMVRLWRALGRYRGDASGRTYALAIARRAAADSIRRTAREKRLVGRVHDHDRGEATPDASRRVELQQAIDALDPDRRDAFVLTQVLGLPYDETAAVCGVPIGTIRSRVARARADLMTNWVADEAVG
jgi:RNA polymerase sigma-70 factor (ECF subfamily)